MGLSERGACPTPGRQERGAESRSKLVLAKGFGDDREISIVVGYSRPAVACREDEGDMTGPQDICDRKAQFSRQVQIEDRGIEIHCRRFMHRVRQTGCTSCDLVSEEFEIGFDEHGQYGAIFYDENPTVRQDDLPSNL